MNASIQTSPAYHANSKPLWAAVGVLSVAVLAMGAGLVYVQTRPMDMRPALVATAPAMQTEMATVAKSRALESATQEDDLVAPPKPPVAVVKPKPAKPVRPARTVARAAPVPAAAPQTAVAAAGGAATTGAPSIANDGGWGASQPVARPICANCGRIESVTTVQRDGSPAGVGAVAGGVLGAVVGNQVGKGGGRTVATILGAIGGGMAGNAIEKNVRKETVYQARVRMEDGSTRTVEQANSPAVGDQVIVEGGAMRSADGGWSSSPAPRPLPQSDVRPYQSRS